MYVGCCSIKFYLHGNHSLKGKRRIVRMLKDRLRNKFNVSIAEIGDHDLWQSLHIGIVSINSDFQYLDGQMNIILDTIEKMYLAEIIDQKVQITRLAPELN